MMTAPDVYAVHRARMDGLDGASILTEEALAVITAAMDSATEILRRWPNAVDNEWLEPHTRALVAAVQRFASTEQPRKCAWDGCPEAATSWGVCDDHLDTPEVREALALDLEKGPTP